MKLDGRCILGFAVALAMASSAEGGLVESIFSNEETEEKKVEFPQGAGWFLDEEEFQSGVRGFRCLEDLAGVENKGNWGQNLMRPISRVMLKAYGEEGINLICGSQLLARMKLKKARNGLKDRSGNRILREVTKPAGNATTPERRTQAQSLCSSFPARYAGNKESIIYDNFARSHLQDYLRNGDATERTKAVKTFSLQDQMATVRLASNVFYRCSQLWSTLNQFLAIPDVPGINQESISEAVQTFVCDLPGTYTDIAMLRLQRDQELIDFHNELVNGAEIGAMYQNTNKLMVELCERDATMARVLDEIDELRDAVNRM